MDGFQDVLRTDVSRSSQIRQGAGHLVNAVMGAGRKTHLLHRLFEVAGGFRVELAMLAVGNASNAGGASSGNCASKISVSRAHEASDAA